jgi:hypothetical protein
MLLNLNLTCGAKAPLPYIDTDDNQALTICPRIHISSIMVDIPDTSNGADRSAFGSSQIQVPSSLSESMLRRRRSVDANGVLFIYREVGAID